MADVWDNRQREKNKKAAGFLLLFLSVCVMGMVWYREEARQTMGKTEEVKKVALTFDDDVIIGLSQEISYKEAVSMI